MRWCSRCAKRTFHQIYGSRLYRYAVCGDCGNTQRLPTPEQTDGIAET